MWKAPQWGQQTQPGLGSFLDPTSRSFISPMPFRSSPLPHIIASSIRAMQSHVFDCSVTALDPSLLGSISYAFFAFLLLPSIPFSWSQHPSAPSPCVCAFPLPFPPILALELSPPLSPSESEEFESQEESSSDEDSPTARGAW